MDFLRSFSKTGFTYMNQSHCKCTSPCMVPSAFGSVTNGLSLMYKYFRLCKSLSIEGSSLSEFPLRSSFSRVFTRNKESGRVLSRFCASVSCLRLGSWSIKSGNSPISLWSSCSFQRFSREKSSIGSTDIRLFFRSMERRFALASYWRGTCCKLLMARFRSNWAIGFESLS